MKITIKSDITGKEYTGDTLETVVAECENAEAEFKKAEAEKAEQEKKKAAEKLAVEEAKSSVISKQKKELAKNVELAEDKLTEAYKSYDEAKQTATEKLNAATKEAQDFLDDARKTFEQAKAEARELYQKAQQQYAEDLKPAEQVLRDAENEKHQAVMKFTEKFGPYQITYTGERAIQEHKKLQKRIDEIFEKELPQWFKFFMF